MADATISAVMPKRALVLAGMLAATTLGWPGGEALVAQEVVQNLPPREAAQLNAALRRLASRPADLDALVSAGNASLALRDAGAAAGFFGRAANVAAGDPRVLLGLARVALEQRRPVAALQAFAQAESAGIKPLDMAADRALAYDLVGDNAAAQALYRSALAADDDNAELRRRLALSLAISGNRQEFERMLYPLLRDEDRGAFRTRAFGLAVLGRPDEAVAIADAMMPTDLALRMAPYLRYMPRLTKAQQAAAGNLGSFPAAAEIGRDSAEIANYASAGARIAANASASLTPSGVPMGPRAQSSAQSSPQSPAQPRLQPSTPAPPPLKAATNPARVAQPAQAIPGVLGPRPAIASSTPVTTPPAMPGVLSQRPPTPTVAPAPARTPAAGPTPTPQAVVVASSPSALAPAPAAAQAERQSLADAFAEFGGGTTTAGSPAAGAVDIAKLTPVRRTAAATPLAATAKPAEKAPAKPKPKVEKPAEPSRIWLQVGVGRNTGAFAFDWRKLARQAGGALDGKGPWAVKYGASNRMLAGPYANDAAAKAAIKRLKDKDIEALPFTSDAGEVVKKIG